MPYYHHFNINYCTFMIRGQYGTKPGCSYLDPRPWISGLAERILFPTLLPA
jgi:hypothetical protein